MTITGKTVAETLREVPDAPRKDQDVIRQWDNPLYAQGHLAILRGNLAPEGCVAKITGIEHRGNHRAGARFRTRRGLHWTRSSRARSKRATCS